MNFILNGEEGVANPFLHKVGGEDPTPQENNQLKVLSDIFMILLFDNNFIKVSFLLK